VHDSQRKVVVIQQRLAAGIPGQRKSVSCDCCIRVVTAIAADPLYIPALPGEPCVASPSGACATRPRASIGQNETPERMASSIVACNCAWLSTPCSVNPLAK
jgi:hypothetical protein